MYNQEALVRTTLYVLRSSGVISQEQMHTALATFGDLLKKGFDTWEDLEATAMIQALSCKR